MLSEIIGVEIECTAQGIDGVSVGAVGVGGLHLDHAITAESNADGRLGGHNLDDGRIEGEFGAVRRSRKANLTAEELLEGEELPRRAWVLSISNETLTDAIIREVGYRQHVHCLLWGEPKEPANHRVKEVVVECPVGADKPVLTGAIASRADRADSTTIDALNALGVSLGYFGKEGTASSALISPSTSVIRDGRIHAMSEPLGNVWAEPFAFG